MLSIIRLKSAEEYEELQSEESRIAESFSKNSLQTIQKNPESFCKNPFCKESILCFPCLLLGCCWWEETWCKKKEQEQDGELDGGVRDSRPTLELCLMLSTLLLWRFAGKKLTWLVRAMANPVAPRIVVTSHEDVAIRAFLSWASDLGGLAPNDLCVMTASIGIQACVGVVVVPVALMHPLLHRFPWLPVLAYSPEDILAVRPAWMLQSTVSILQSFNCPVVCECSEVVVPN